jgi:hypothetical protein
MLWRPSVAGQVFGVLVSFGAFRTFIWDLGPHVTTTSGAKCSFLFFLMPQRKLLAVTRSVDKALNTEVYLGGFSACLI